MQDCNLPVFFSLLQRKSANLSVFVSVQISGCNKSIMNFALRMFFVLTWIFTVIIFSPTSLDLYLISTVCPTICFGSNESTLGTLSTENFYTNISYSHSHEGNQRLTYIFYIYLPQLLNRS